MPRFAKIRNLFTRATTPLSKTPQGEEDTPSEKSKPDPKSLEAFKPLEPVEGIPAELIEALNQYISRINSQIEIHNKADTPKEVKKQIFEEIRNENKMPKYPKEDSRRMKSFKPLIQTQEVPPDFIQATNQAIATINGLITIYNKDDTPPAVKKQILLLIQNEIKRIDYTFPQSFFAASPAYRLLHTELDKEIHYQFASMTSRFSLDHNLLSSPPEIIANMSQDKADAMFDILMKNLDKSPQDISKALKKLYEWAKDSPEKRNFEKFLEDYVLELIGDGNTKVLKLSHRVTGQTFVLKMTDNLNKARTAEAHLRDSELGQRLTPIHAERQVSRQLETGETVSNSLQIIDFYPLGNLAEYVFSIQYAGLQPVSSPGQIFEQMASIFLDIQQEDCFFSDAKINNWMIDSQGQLHIADAKSLLLLGEDGKFHKKDPGNRYERLLFTDYCYPPEYNIKYPDISADSAHAFMLGKNLYHCFVGYPAQGDSASKFRFDPYNFPGEIGKEYKALIQALVHPNPSKRMSVRDALDQLFMINNPEFKAVLSDLKSLKFGPQDTAMNEYIREQQGRINKAKTPTEKAEILKEMQEMAQVLRADKACMQLHSIVANYRDKGQWFYFKIGMNLKASQIELAMSQIPLEDRKDLLKSNQTKDVMEALALNRGDKTGKKHLDDQGHIDPEKSAAAFKQFKKEFNIETDRLNKLTGPQNDQEGPAQIKR